jgi:hypothetical protein
MYVRSLERSEMAELEHLLVSSGFVSNPPVVEGFTPVDYASAPEARLFMRVGDAGDLTACDERWDVALVGREVHGRDAGPFLDLLDSLVTLGGTSVVERWGSLFC